MIATRLLPLVAALVLALGAAGARADEQVVLPGPDLPATVTPASAWTATPTEATEAEAPRFVASSRGDRPTISATLRERAEAHGVSPWLLDAMGACESKYDPRAVGRQGEVGLLQLHPRGLLPLFYARGYDDPWSVWQQADFGGWALAHGLAGHWSCYWTLVR